MHRKIEFSGSRTVFTNPEKTMLFLSLSPISLFLARALSLSLPLPHPLSPSLSRADRAFCTADYARRIGVTRGAYFDNK